MKKTRIYFREGAINGEWKMGETGYIDGYLMQSDNRPFAVVVKDDGKIVLGHISVIRALNSDDI